MTAASLTVVHGPLTGSGGGFLYPGTVCTVEEPRAGGRVFKLFKQRDDGGVYFDAAAESFRLGAPAPVWVEANVTVPGRVQAAASVVNGDVIESDGTLYAVTANVRLVSSTGRNAGKAFRQLSCACGAMLSFGEDTPVFVLEINRSVRYRNDFKPLADGVEDFIARRAELSDAAK